MDLPCRYQTVVNLRSGQITDFVPGRGAGKGHATCCAAHSHRSCQRLDVTGVVRLYVEIASAQLQRGVDHFGAVTRGAVGECSAFFRVSHTIHCVGGIRCRVGSRARLGVGHRTTCRDATGTC